MRCVLLIERGHRVDIVLFGARIHYPAEVPRKARLFVVDRILDDRTQKSVKANEILANLTQLSVPSKSGDWLSIMDALRWDPLCLPDARLVRYVRAVSTYVSRERPDCIVPSLPRAKIATLLACRLSGSHPPPVVPTIRNDVVQGRRHAHRRSYRRLFGQASHFVCVSQGVADGLVRTIGVPPTKVSVIHKPSCHTGPQHSDGRSGRPSLDGGRGTAGHSFRRKTLRTKRLSNADQGFLPRRRGAAVSAHHPWGRTKAKTP